MDDPVGHGGEGGVVGDDHHGHALLAAGVLQQLEDGLAGDVVQRAGGLVAQQQLGVLGQGPGDGHPLLLAAGQLGGEVPQPVAQAHVLQHVPGIQGMVADLGGQLHVLQGGEVLHQVVELEHEADVVPPVAGELPGVEVADPHAVHGDDAAGTAVHAAQHVQHGGLARAGGAHDDGELALFDDKIHPVGGVDGHLAHFIGLSDLLKGDVAHGISSFLILTLF